MGDSMNLKYIDLAYEEALKAFELGEVPVGCVIVKDDKVLSKTHNLKEKNNNSLDHAEMLAIKEVSKELNNWRLDGCDIYITLSPCPMCASAIKQARISNIYCGIINESYDFELIKNILENTDNNSKCSIEINLDKTRCGNLLKKFFKMRRFD